MVVILYLWPHLHVVHSSVSLVIVGKYYIVTSNVGSFLYLIEIVLICTGVSPLPWHQLPEKYWGCSGFGIHLYQTKINCWFYHFLYLFMWIKIKIELIKKNCYYCPFNLTFLKTMSHSDFSKCRMIRTIEAWTKVLAIKFMVLYKNWLGIIILLFTLFENKNTHLYYTH